MKQFLLATTILVAAAPTAWAATCTPTVMGNLNVFDCASNNQPSDGDELKLFINKAGVPVTSITGSLNKNTGDTVFQNIMIDTPNTGATFSQQGNGFAELKSGEAGSQSNTLRDLVFTPIQPSSIDGHPVTSFPGFDGFFARGQVDGIGGAWDGVVTMTIDFKAGNSQVLTFDAGKGSQDIGAIGFDGATALEPLVASVSMTVDSTGAWNEAKQFTFSVPGAVEPIPEPRTWVMLILGFGAMAIAGFRRRARLAI